MINHPWIDAADADNSLVCDVLLTLCQYSPPPPPPQDAPAITNPLDWSIRRRRSKSRIEIRPAGGSSSSNPSRNSGTDGATEIIGPFANNDATTASGGAVIAAGGVDVTSGGTESLTGESKSKATSAAEPSGKTPTKKLKKRKHKETLKAFITEHRKKNETRRVIKIKKKPTPPGESQGANLAEPQLEPEPHQGQPLVEPQGLHVVVEPLGPQVVAEPLGTQVAPDPQGPQVAEPQQVVSSAETKGTEVVATEMVGAGGTEEESIAADESQKKIDDDAEEEDKYILPDLNIPYVDDTFP